MQANPAQNQFLLRGVYSRCMPAGRPALKPTPAFGERLATLRKQKGWTQPELAQRLGLAIKTITYYEREAKNPTAKTIEQFAQVFGVSKTELIGENNPKHKERKPGPPSHLQKLFDEIVRLPRSKQKIMADFIDGYLSKFRNESTHDQSA